jgi:hypothetical protein
MWTRSVRVAMVDLRRATWARSTITAGGAILLFASETRR